MLDVTELAAGVLRSADAAARRFNPDARIRLRPGGRGLVTDLADAPGDDESSVTIAEVEIIVADNLAGTIDAGDHDTLVLVPGSPRP